MCFTINCSLLMRFTHEMLAYTRRGELVFYVAIVVDEIGVFPKVKIIAQKKRLPS